MSRWLLRTAADLGAAPDRFRQILKKIVQTKREMGKSMREASFALVEAKYSAGEFRHTVFDAVEKVHRPSLAAGWLSVLGLYMVLRAETIQAASQHACGFPVPLQRISCTCVLASPADQCSHKHDLGCMIVQALPSWSRPGMLQAPACALLPAAGIVWVDAMWHHFALARLQWASLFFHMSGGKMK